MNNSSFPESKHQFVELDMNISFSKTVRILLAVFLIAAFVIGTVGNVIVLFLFIRYKTLRTTSNIFVVNLTVADLLICLVCLPTLVNVYLRGNSNHSISTFFCNFDAFLGAIAGFLSIWSLVCLAADRCIVIRRHLPVRHSSGISGVIFAIVGVWILALIGAGLPFVGFGRFVFKGTTMACSSFDIFTKSFSNIVYNVLIQVVFFIIPVTIMICCYSVIFTKVRNHEKRFFYARKGRKSHEITFRRICKGRNIERNEIKTAKAGLILISIFCLSWAPYSIVSWIGLIGETSQVAPLAVALSAIFAKVFTILNPLVYALLLQSFKSKLVLCCKPYLPSKLSSSGTSERPTCNQTQLTGAKNSPLITHGIKKCPITAV